MNTVEFDAMISNSVSSATRSTVNAKLSTFATDATSRNEGFQQLEQSLDVEFVNVEIDAFVSEIISQTADTLVAGIYETTVIEYYASEDVTVTDIMGYGTMHEIGIQKTGGGYSVVSDSFDERIMTGKCSVDVAEDGKVLSSETANDLSFAEVIESRAVTYIVDDSYNVTAAINYANQWCGIPAASRIFSDSGSVEGDDSTDLYNSEYDFYDGYDCANFVSQCLSAGGFIVPSDSWAGAKALHLYLRNSDYEITRVTSSNYSLVFPGNPVYWWNGNEEDPSDKGGTLSTGHQMICTGYNAAGIPVINAHSPNMFRVPINDMVNNGSGGLHTARIVNQNKHSHVSDLNEGYYVCTPSTHGVFCKMCRNGFNHQVHTMVTSGTEQYCSVCGYSGSTNIQSIVGDVILVE